MVKPAPGIATLAAQLARVLRALRSEQGPSLGVAARWVREMLGFTDKLWIIALVVTYSAFFACVTAVIFVAGNRAVPTVEALSRSALRNLLLSSSKLEKRLSHQTRCKRRPDVRPCEDDSPKRSPPFLDFASVLSTNITLVARRCRSRSAVNPHAACDAAGAGDGATDSPTRARREKSRTRPRRHLRAPAPALDATGVKFQVRRVSGGSLRYSGASEFGS